MALIKSAGTGNWNTTGTWTGGAVPGASDTWEIQNGHNVTIAAELTYNTTSGTIDNGGTLTVAFQMSTSYFNGNITVASGGTIYASRSLSSFLRVQGTITVNGTNGIDYGTGAGNAIPAGVGAFIQFICASDNLAGRGIVMGANNSVSFYGAPRVMSSYLANSALINATTIVINDDMVLRSGALAAVPQGTVDMIVVGQNPTLGVGVGAENYQIEAFLVGGYVAGTKTVTLADAGAGQSYWPRGGNSGNSYAGLATARATNTPVWLLSMNVGVVGSAYNLRPANGINAAGYSIATYVNASLWWCYYGLYNSPNFTSASNTISGNTYGLGSCSGATISGGTLSGNNYGLFSCFGATISGGTLSGNSYGLNSCSFKAYAVTFASNTYDIFQSVFILEGITLVSSPDNYLYTSLAKQCFSESINANGVAAAYKAWTANGITTSVASPAPTGFARSYQVTPTSATIPGFWQRSFVVPAGRTVQWTFNIQKSVTMSVKPYTQVFLDTQEPLLGGSVLNTFTYPDDTTGTWKTGTFTWTNTDNYDKVVIVRFNAVNTTGYVYTQLTSVIFGAPVSIGPLHMSMVG